MKRIVTSRGKATGWNEPEGRVFVVDDDQSVRRSLAILLSTEHYKVETFASAIEYLERPLAPGPACVILDVRLPRLDGPALQRKLTEEDRVEQIVFITGHGDLPTGIDAMKRGAVDFLPKPFKDDDLLSAVEPGACALRREVEAARRDCRNPRATCETHTAGVRGLEVGHCRATQQADRCRTWHRASYD
jgi:FixJ family two-component response regulator